MVTASALAANCGHPRALSKITPRSANAQAAMAKGNLFHLAVEDWAKAGAIPDVADDEVRGWLELLAMTWAPSASMRFEMALGLSPLGQHVEVDEPEPHVYVPRGGGELLTAGRADCVHVIDVGPRIVHVKDWKTGKYAVTPATRNLQLSALALAAADLFGSDGFVREIYYARDGYTDRDHEPVMMDSPEAADAWSMVLLAAQLDDAPRPGPWCQPCWERRTKRCKHAQETTT